MGMMPGSGNRPPYLNTTVYAISAYAGPPVCVCARVQALQRRVAVLRHPILLEAIFPWHLVVRGAS